MYLQQFLHFKFTELDLAILVLGFAVGFIGFIYFIFKDNPWKPLYWPSVPAIIEESTVAKEITNTGQPLLYRPHIKFRYNYKGTDYISSTFSQSYSSKKDRAIVETVCNQYSIGVNALCYVNPKDPGTAYLTVSKSRAILFTLGMSVFMIGFPLAAYFFIVFRDRS